MSDTQALLAEIERYITEAGIAASTFGERAVRNSKLVARLRRGESVNLNTAALIREFIATGIPAKQRTAA